MRVGKAIALAYLFALFFQQAIAGDGTLFGPEIELMGNGHYPGVICTAAIPVSAAGSLLYFAGDQLKKQVWNRVENRSNHSYRPLPKAPLLGLLGTTMICSLHFYFGDPMISKNVYLKRIARSYEREAQEGKVSLKWIRDGWKGKALEVNYPSGRQIVFAQDPNVIEVRIGPTRTSTARENEDFLQRELFDRAARSGLRAPSLDGPWNGGHVHIDIRTAFDSDPRKLKNFVLDFIHHGELSGGIWGRDFYSAAPISLKANRKIIEEFASYMDELSRNHIKLDRAQLEEIMKRFRKLFTKPFRKGSALYINTRFGTLEIRSLRSPRNAETLRATFEVLSARIHYTNTHSIPIPETDHLADKANWATLYRQYLEEAGLDYQHYRRYIPARFQAGATSAFCLLKQLTSKIHGSGN